VKNAFLNARTIRDWPALTGDIWSRIAQTQCLSCGGTGPAPYLLGVAESAVSSSTWYDLTDLTKTSPAYFLTRWVSHFCAPTFVFLAGTGAFLAGTRKTKGQLSWFLLTRGLWLILLEVTVVRYSWFMNVNYAFTVGQVIWAIGCAMVVLSGLVFLPLSAVTALGVALIACHNAFDPWDRADWGRWAWLWNILHSGKTIEWAPEKLFGPAYPLLSWIGVMAAGYGFGALWLLPPRRRRPEVLGLGIVLILTFVALRYGNQYGDRPASHPGQAGPWSVQKDWLFTVLSFVNCQKYPPSLCFVLMTLGPAITLMALCDRQLGALGRFLVTFGRVPLFFYLLHWYVLKGLEVLFALCFYGRADWIYGENRPPAPLDNQYPLWAVYLIWLGVVALLYPLCRWYAGVKQRSRSPWLSYL
jgi:uncharacterized membrane protein